jgi:hypothetical protein
MESDLQQTKKDEMKLLEDKKEEKLKSLSAELEKIKSEFTRLVKDRIMVRVRVRVKNQLIKLIINLTLTVSLTIFLLAQKRPCSHNYRVPQVTNLFFI